MSAAICIISIHVQAETPQTLLQTHRPTHHAPRPLTSESLRRVALGGSLAVSPPMSLDTVPRAALRPPLSAQGTTVPESTRTDTAPR